MYNIYIGFPATSVSVEHRAASCSHTDTYPTAGLQPFTPPPKPRKKPDQQQGAPRKKIQRPFCASGVRAVKPLSSFIGPKYSPGSRLAASPGTARSRRGCAGPAKPGSDSFFFF